LDRLPPRDGVFSCPVTVPRTPPVTTARASRTPPVPPTVPGPTCLG